jgi:replication-associated recombination protein RarA
VLGGIKEIREAVEQASIQAQGGRRTIVFVDEAHRFNKAGFVLPHGKRAVSHFIGPMTENPSFEVTQRCPVDVLHPGRVIYRNCARALKKKSLGRY